jgi:hypothetical protein
MPPCSNVPGQQVSSPRTRGWSRMGRNERAARRVVPAHAGLVRGSTSSSTKPRSRPRAGGAGPRSTWCPRRTSSSTRTANTFSPDRPVLSTIAASTRSCCAARCSAPPVWTGTNKAMCGLVSPTTDSRRTDGSDTGQQSCSGSSTSYGSRHGPGEPAHGTSRTPREHRPVIRRFPHSRKDHKRTRPPRHPHTRTPRHPHPPRDLPLEQARTAPRHPERPRNHSTRSGVRLRSARIRERELTASTGVSGR